MNRHDLFLYAALVGVAAAVAAAAYQYGKHVERTSRPALKCAAGYSVSKQTSDGGLTCYYRMDHPRLLQQYNART